jgi:type II secretory pathway component HofQ
LDSLNELVKQATGQKFTPNFIIKDPSGKLKLPNVTLDLANIPASQVLQYIASFAQCRVIYEEHAIVVEAK